MNHKYCLPVINSCLNTPTNHNVYRYHLYNLLSFVKLHQTSCATCDTSATLGLQACTNGVVWTNCAHLANSNFESIIVSNQSLDNTLNVCKVRQSILLQVRQLSLKKIQIIIIGVTIRLW